MVWALKATFTLHYIVFKQCGAHLAHEGNVENLFSKSGNLSDPNLDPQYLSKLTRIGANKHAFCPLDSAIKDRYFERFRACGPDGNE
jgi:hypothetical protein